MVADAPAEADREPVAEGEPVPPPVREGVTVGAGVPLTVPVVVSEKVAEAPTLRVAGTDAAHAAVGDAMASLVREGEGVPEAEGGRDAEGGPEAVPPPPPVSDAATDTVCVGAPDTVFDWESGVEAEAHAVWLALRVALPVAEGDTEGARDGECEVLEVGVVEAPLALALTSALAETRLALWDALAAAVCVAVGGPVGAAVKEMVAEAEAEPEGRDVTDAEELVAGEGLTLGVPVPVAHRVSVPVAETLAPDEAVADKDARSEMLAVIAPVRDGVGYTEIDTVGAPVAEVEFVGAGVPVGASIPVAETVGEPRGVPLSVGEGRGELDVEAHFDAVGVALALPPAEREACAESVGVWVRERLGVGDVEGQLDSEGLTVRETVGDAVGGAWEGDDVGEKLAELEGEPEARGEWEKDGERVGGAPVLLTERLAPPPVEGVGVPVREGSGEREEEGVAVPDTDSRALLLAPLPVAAIEGDAVLVHVTVPPLEALPLPEALPAGEREALPPVALTLTLGVSVLERVSAEEGMNEVTAELEGVVVKEEEGEPE